MRRSEDLKYGKSMESMFKAGTKTLASALVELIRRDIIAGEFLPGTKLRIKVLAERYDAGPIPIREALSRLSAVGLIDAHEQRGFWVAPISATELNELLALRKNLEYEALKESVAHGNYEWEAQLLAAHHRLVHHSAAAGIQGKDPTVVGPEWDKAHKAFHIALLAGCKSRWQMRFINTLSDQMNRYRHLSIHGGYSHQRDIDGEHKDLLEAALARDVDRACLLLDEHLTRTVEFALLALSKRGDL